MTNPMYTRSTGAPVQGSRGRSSVMRNEYDLIEDAFDIAFLYCADTSVSANTITITPPAALASLSDGLEFRIKVANATTGATTVNMGGSIGSIPLKRDDGSAITTDILAGQVIKAIYKHSSACLVLAAPTKNYIDQLQWGASLPAKPNDGNKYVPRELNNSVDWSRLKTIGGQELFGTGDIVTGISTVGATVTGDYTIASATPTIWPCATTAIGKCLTAPAANGAGMTKGLFAVIDNKSGGYPVGYRDSTGVLITSVPAGGVAHIYLEDTSTAAGTWRAEGANLEPGLITIDNTFSSTYSSTVLKPFVALDDNKSIHFLLGSAGTDLYAVAVDKSTGAVGTPVLAWGGVSTINAAFKVSATQAIVFYSNANAVLLNLSGATTLTGTSEFASGVSGMFAAEDFSGAPKIAQLSSSLYLVSFTSGTNTSVKAASVSGNTVTWGATANIITANSVANSTTTYALTATTALVIYLSGTTPYQLNAVVVSVSGTTCTVGTPAGVAGIIYNNQICSSCLLSATKALVLTDENQLKVSARAITITGTAVAFGAVLDLESMASDSRTNYVSDSATRYNPHLFPISASTALCWYKDGSGISRAVVLSESGGTVTAGTILYNSISSAATNTTAGGAILPQGTSEFASVTKSNVGAAGDASALSITPHKISGTSITTGPAVLADKLGLPTAATTAIATRLNSGDYCLFPQVNGGEMQVFRSNGDRLAYKGSLGVPIIFTAPAYPVHNVSSNRLVFLMTSRSTTVGAGTYQLRLLSVEICA